MGPFASPARRLAASCARSVRARAGSVLRRILRGARRRRISRPVVAPRISPTHTSSTPLTPSSALPLTSGSPPPAQLPFADLRRDDLGDWARRDRRRSESRRARVDGFVGAPRRSVTHQRLSFFARGPRVPLERRDPRARGLLRTLGVPRSANQGDIKKAYYKLAQKYHPDKNKDDPASEKRFQEVQKAYETLKDPQSRGMYDQVGHGNYEQMENGGGGGGGGPGGFPGGQGGGFEGFPGGFRMHFGGGGPGGPGGPVDFEDLFSDFFGGGGPARDIQTTLRVTLAEVKSGTSRTVRVPETRTVDPRTGVSETHPARDVKVDLPAGVEDGQRLRVQGREGQGRDGRERVGNLYIDVDVAEDPRFARVGADLVTKAEISFPGRRPRRDRSATWTVKWR